MPNVFTCILLLIICNSVKIFYFYTVIGVDVDLLLIHVVSSIGLSMGVFPLAFAARRRIWFALLYLLQAMVIFIYIKYFQYFGTLLHLKNAYVLLSEALVLARNLLIPINFSDIVFIADIPVFLYLLYKHGQFSIPEQIFKISIRISAAVTALTLTVLAIQPVNRSLEPTKWTRHFVAISRFGIIGHLGTDLFELSKSPPVIPVSYGQEFVTFATYEKKPNIIMIQVESLDANIVNQTYHNNYITPFFHSLTDNSLYFPYAISYRTVGGTSDTEITVNNGIEPLTDRPLIMDYNYTYPDSVVKKLKKYGYVAMAFHGNSGKFYRRHLAYSAMGYSNFHDPLVMKLPEKGWGVPDHDLLNYVENQLDKIRSPFFLSIITMSSHEPFNLRHFESDGRFERVFPQLTRNYFESISYADREVEHFVKKIKARYPNTYFFIFGDHSAYALTSGAYKTSNAAIGNDQLMEVVPLFILTPDGKKYSERNLVASLLDVYPSIISAAGIGCTYRSFGDNLLEHGPHQKKVVYRGEWYSRGELFRYISQENKININLSP